MIALGDQQQWPQFAIEGTQQNNLCEIRDLIHIVRSYIPHHLAQ